MPRPRPDPDDARQEILNELGRTGVPSAREIDAEVTRRGYDPTVVERGLRNGFAPGVIASALQPSPPEPEAEVTLERGEKQHARVTMRQLDRELRERGLCQFKSFVGRGETRWMPRELAAE